MKKILLIVMLVLLCVACWALTPNTNSALFSLETGDQDSAINNNHGGIVSNDLYPGGGYETGSSIAIPGKYVNERVDNLSITVDGLSVMLIWDEVAGASLYKVYSSATPEGDFSEDLSGSFDGTSWTASITQDRTFYYVTSFSADIPDNFVFVEGGTIYPTTGIFTGGLTVYSFYIDKYELTNAGWEDVMGTGGGDNNPHAYVSWFDAIEYCNRRSLQEGLTPLYSYLTFGTNPDDWPSGWNSISSNSVNFTCNWTSIGYRLPMEGEWEYAARGGLSTQGYIYSGSNVLNDVGWYGNNSSGFPHPVGELAPNELGTFDMSGNVVEWCWELYSAAYHRVVRGGTYTSGASSCTVFYDNGRYAASSWVNVGFRVCRTP